MKRIATPLLVLLVAACASDDYKIEMPDVTVKAAEESAGTRVTFHLRKGEISDKPIKLEAEFGDMRDFVRSNDLRTCSVLWMDGGDLLHCTYPYGQQAEFSAEEGELLKDHFLYTFLMAQGVSVSSRIARGAPILPRLIIRIELDEKNRPATLQWEGRDARHLTKKISRLALELPRDRKTNVLQTGDWRLTLTTPTQKLSFLIGVDPDGTPTASSGSITRIE